MGVTGAVCGTSWIIPPYLSGKGITVVVTGGAVVVTGGAVVVTAGAVAVVVTAGAVTAGAVTVVVVVSAGVPHPTSTMTLTSTTANIIVNNFFIYVLLFNNHECSD